MAHSVGESKQGCLWVDFNHRLKLEFHGSKVTSDAGLLAYRELDDAIELTEMVGDVLADSRTGKNGRHGMVGQVRQPDAHIGFLAGLTTMGQWLSLPMLVVGLTLVLRARRVG